MVHRRGGGRHQAGMSMTGALRDNPALGRYEME